MTMLWLRRARWFDGNFCFRLRNENEPESERRNWIAATITPTADWRPYIIMLGVRRVGRLAIMRRPGGIGLPVTIAPEFRRRGIGRWAVLRARSIARRDLGQQFCARIKSENLASQRLYGSVGYRHAGGERWVYRR